MTDYLRRFRSSVAVALGAAFVLAVPAAAQGRAGAPVQDIPSTTLDEIIVPGRRLEEAVQAYVESLSAPARMRGLARWNGEICLDVVNLQADAETEVASRIRGVGTALDLEVVEEDCEPNLVVIGSEDGPALANAMVDRFRRQFFRFSSPRSNRGAAALEAFRSSKAPVRWWHVSLPVHAVTGQPMVKMFGEPPPSPPCHTRSTATSDLSVAGIGGSRTGPSCNAVTDRILGLWIVVDVEAAEGLSWAQLSDYLAFVAMAQVDPEGDLSGYDTVLNLFQEPDLVSGMTTWDESYLMALYAGRNERIDPREQRTRMVEVLTAAQTSSTPSP